MTMRCIFFLGVALRRSRHRPRVDSGLQPGSLVGTCLIHRAQPERGGAAATAKKKMHRIVISRHEASLSLSFFGFMAPRGFVVSHPELWFCRVKEKAKDPR